MKERPLSSKCNKLISKLTITFFPFCAITLFLFCYLKQKTTLTVEAKPVSHSLLVILTMTTWMTSCPLTPTMTSSIILHPWCDHAPTPTDRTQWAKVYPCWKLETFQKLHQIQSPPRSPEVVHENLFQILKVVMAMDFLANLPEGAAAEEKVRLQFVMFVITMINFAADFTIWSYYWKSVQIKHGCILILIWFSNHMKLLFLGIAINT